MVDEEWSTRSEGIVHPSEKGSHSTPSARALSSPLPSYPCPAARYFLETSSQEIMQALLHRPEIANARIRHEGGAEVGFGCSAETLPLLRRRGERPNSPNT